MNHEIQPGHDHPNYVRCGHNCPDVIAREQGEMRTIDEFLADPTPAEQPELTVKPLLVDDFPVDYDEGSINIYVRDGDVNALLSVTDRPRDYEPDEEDEDDVTTGVDMFLDDDELMEIAKTCARVLAAMGKRDHLAELISEAATALAENR
ncbi:MAG TPA: hypothetical protein VH419_06325 [Nocardioidaceae bacterium]|jgi:hypothetical protein